MGCEDELISSAMGAKRSYASWRVPSEVSANMENQQYWISVLPNRRARKGFDLEQLLSRKSYAVRAADGCTHSHGA